MALKFDMSRGDWQRDYLLQQQANQGINPYKELGENIATGAGAVGGNAIAHDGSSGRTENGGAGLANNFRNGTDVTYARGGCGGNDSGGAPGFRGDGDANTGEGGAGAGGSTAHAGGSGIVVIRYKM